MNKTLLIFLTAVTILSSCSKQNKYQAEGTLTGADMAFCGCCGGIILAIDNKPGNFRIDSLPFMPHQQLYNLSFPKRIKFNYTSKNTCGGIERLSVTEFYLKN